MVGAMAESSASRWKSLVRRAMYAHEQEILQDALARSASLAFYPGRTKENSEQVCVV